MTETKAARKWRHPALLALLLITPACQNVEFYEREKLQDHLMVLEEDRTETHFLQKIYHSREGAVGGIGTSAGGGCGCY